VVVAAGKLAARGNGHYSVPGCLASNGCPNSQFGSGVSFQVEPGWPMGWPGLGVPTGEIVWAFVFGVFWPLFVGVIFDVEIVRQPVVSKA
jgi:hypothetical protein